MEANRLDIKVPFSATPHYIFFATIEIISLLEIIWYAWKWKNPEVAKIV
jgi:hypothetical protein